MPGGLLTDLYELNMAASYLRHGMTGPATFSLYVRELPPTRGFIVAAGLEHCLDFLESFSFEEDDLMYLSTVGFEREHLDAFREIRFDGEAWAVAEGRVLYSEEPMLEVTAPMPVAQLVETYLLNQVTLHTTLATKAARYRLAAGDRQLVDFAFRRSHGAEAAMAVARASAVVGFAATSNVEAARRFGLRVAGTMAHSFIESFPTELDAFRTFAQDHPDRTTFLVDTYDTPNGVRNAIEVIRELSLGEELGIRLDSGDLGHLSREARRILDGAGMSHVRIFASGGLDEHEVEALVHADAPVDAFGIGTQLGVSADAPYVDSVYKLVEFEGPVMKLSAHKQTAPGRKQVWRGPEADLLGLRDEEGPADAEPLLTPVMRGGVRTPPPPSIAEIRRRFEAELPAIPDAARRLRDPEPLVPLRSEGLRRLTEQARHDALRRAGMKEGSVDGRG